MNPFGSTKLIDPGAEMKRIKPETVAKNIVTEILDRGLADSTFRDKHPDAYDELLEYRADLEASAIKILKRNRK